MAKLIRSMFVAAFAAFLFSFLPGLASAQNVHEVRPAGVGEIRIGVHGPASMEAVVALARRISENPALTADDVIANLSHARRYVCRVGGRMVYFGPDPEYGGRCPEDGVRSDGTLRGAVYRVPREHDAVLAPSVRRARRSAVPSVSDPAQTAQIAELERRLEVTSERLRLAEQTATDAGAARIRAESEVSRLREENTRLARELEAAREDGVTIESRVNGVTVWGWLVILALMMLAVAFVLFGLVILPREKRPLVHRIDELEEVNTTVEGELMAKNVEAEEATEALQKARRRIKSLRAAGTRVLRMFRRVVEENRVLKENEEGAATELAAYRQRKARIAENHAKLTELREREEPFLHLETLIRLTETDRVFALGREDAKTVRDCDEVLTIYREHLEPLGDPSDLRAQIAGVQAVLAEHLPPQCGVVLDLRSADERLTEWEERRHEELRHAAAVRQNLETLVSVVEKRALAGVAEITAKRRAFESECASNEELRESLDEHKRLVDAFAGDPSAHAQTILQRDARIADLAHKLREAGIDPGTLPATPSNGSWPEEITENLPLPGSTPARASRKRVPTLVVGASEEAVRVARDSQLPAPPKSPTYALNHAVSKLLDELEILPVDARVIHADNGDAAEWARLLGMCSISAPTIGEVPFRKFLAVVERRVPEWLTERLRRRTDPPPAPSMA